MHTHKYKIYGNNLEHVFKEKDLGVTIDSELTFMGRDIFKSGYPVGGFSKGSENFSGKFKGYKNFPKNCKGYENFTENCKGYENFLENCKGYEIF